MTTDAEHAASRVIMLDIETTGLDPQHDAIIEVHFRHYTKTFELLSEVNLVVESEAYLSLLEDRPGGIEAQVAPFVYDMHKKNGLWTALQSNDGWYQDEAGDQLMDWLYDRGVTKEDPIVGASVDFDKNFMKEIWPDVIDQFSHRVIDTSTLRGFTERWVPNAFATRPNLPSNHRTKNCLDGTVADLKHYIDYLGLDSI